MEFFVQECPAALAPLQDYVRAIATPYGLHTLADHIHQILGAFTLYHAIYMVISPVISSTFFGRHYKILDKRSTINWDVHVVSFVQSSFICVIALWGMFADSERADYNDHSSLEQAYYRVFGYTPIGAAVTAYAAGYFLWDLMISLWHIKIMGLGFVAHAVSALTVYSFGFRPFVNFYAPVFILFELSSPFLNIHWFCDKTGLTGSKIQLINGFALLGTFFGCRVVWGPISSYRVFKDIFSVYAQQQAEARGEVEVEKMLSGLYPGMQVPLWLAIVYLSSNTVLNCLNYYWFSRMIQTVASRFSTPKEKVKKEEEKVWVEGTDVDLATPAKIAGEQVEEVRKRVTRSSR